MFLISNKSIFEIQSILLITYAPLIQENMA